MATLRIGNNIVTPVVYKAGPERFVAYEIDSSGGLQHSTTYPEIMDFSGVQKVNAQALEMAYQNNTAITGTAYFPNLTTLGAQYCMAKCFYNCAGLTEFSAPNLTSIENAGYCCQYVCCLCTSLTNINLGSLTTIAGTFAFSHAFESCTSLTTVSIPSLTSVTSLAAFEDAFKGCTALTTASFSAITDLTGARVFDEAFMNCTSLTTVTIDGPGYINFGSSYTNQLQDMFSGCTQDITLNIATNQATLSTLAGYPTFGCTGNVTINYTVDCTVTLDITGDWISMYIESTGEEIDYGTTTVSIIKNVATKFYILTNNGTYVGKIDAQTGSTYTLTLDLTSVTYNTITLNPDVTTTFLDGSIVIGTNKTSLSVGYLYAHVYNASGESVDVKYLYAQTGYKANTGTYSYTSSDVTVDLTMVVGNPVWFTDSIAYPTYPWRVAETVTAPEGYTEYESTNWHVKSSYSVSKLNFFGTSFTCYINSYAEGNYDYMMISTVDTSQVPTAYNGATVQAHTRGNQTDPTVFPDNYTQVDYTDLTDEQHYVYVVFRKDSSGDQNNDRGYVVFQE